MKCKNAAGLDLYSEALHEVGHALGVFGGIDAVANKLQPWGQMDSRYGDTVFKLPVQAHGMSVPNLAKPGATGTIMVPVAKVGLFKGDP
jgi:hypothetical protein